MSRRCEWVESAFESVRKGRTGNNSSTFHVTYAYVEAERWRENHVDA